LNTVDEKTRSEIMRKIRSKDTKLERKVFSILVTSGINGLTKNPKGIYGNPDFVHKESKIGIFFDSCYWHGCPDHCRMPKSNRKYWMKKISRNKERANEVNEVLKKEGWVVFRLWEHHLSDREFMLKWINDLKETIMSRS
jgi:DNA mismatch endonuclease (patch repair protein)